ncbi:MAG: phosphoribosylpyrophosphate synthetase [Saprospirales bacterium]|nr:phosphoribosylpyrophosphate synthetase [Saprospirales bacterium]
MKTILFAIPGNETLAHTLSEKLGAEMGKAIIRHFPDGESYVRILSDLTSQKVVLICTLDRPDAKLLPLYFLSKIAKNSGARCTCLLSPYLAYMRQDKIFQPGEGVTSKYFAQILSGFADSLITVDPHLHRTSSLNKLYSIPTKVVHASIHISKWIKENVQNPVLIGPDSESEQWVAEVAKNAEAPFLVLEKIRHGDSDVEVSVPNIETFRQHTPVLVDDIISTARTMIETVRHLNRAGMRPPICIGVHAIFAENAFKELLNSGIERVVTCNSVPHPSNAIDLSDLYIDFIENFEKATF